MSPPTRSQRIESSRLEVDAATAKLRDAVAEVERQRAALDEATRPFLIALGQAEIHERAAREKLREALDRLNAGSKP